MDEPTDETAPAKPSKVPSWIMLGFVLGALAIYSLPDSKPEEAPPPVAKAPPAPPGPPRLTDIEAMFEGKADIAVWENDRTEILAWNRDANDFIDAFEVLRLGDNYYFRSIPRLTRPILTHGVENDLLLKYTEPEARRQKWLEDVREENLRSFEQGFRNRGRSTGTPPQE